MKKILKFFIKWFCIVCTIIIMFSAGTYLWLKTTSPCLSIFNSYIEKKIGDINPGYKVKIGDIRFVWSIWQFFPHIKITNVNIYTEKSKQLAQLPEIFLILSPVDFINGKIEPVKIKIISPCIYLPFFDRSDPDKNLTKTEFFSDRKNNQYRLADKIAKHIKIIQNQISALPCKFKKLHIINVNIVNKNIQNSNLNPNFSQVQIKDILLKTKHTKSAIILNLTTEYIFNNKKTNLKILVKQENKSKQNKSEQTEVSINNINPLILAYFFPKNKNIKGYDIPVNISARITNNEHDQIVINNITLENNGGKISNPAIWEKPLFINHIQIKACLTNNLSYLKIEKLIIDSDGPVLKGSGTIKYIKEFPDINIDICVNTLNISDAVRYWPYKLEKNVRKWIKTSIYAGNINDASLKIRFKPKDFQAQTLAENSIQAIVPFHDAVLDYYSPLGVVKQIRGLAKFSTHNIDIDVYDARVNHSRISKGNIFVSGMRNKITRIAINTDVSGPPDDLRKAVDVLTNNTVIPIYINKGQAKTQFTFDFPLTDFDEKKIKYTAYSTIKNMELKDFYGYSIFQKKISAQLVQDNLYVKAFNGIVSHKKNLEEPIKIKKIEAKTVILHKPSGMFIKSFFADIYGPLIQASGHVKIYPDTQNIDLNFNVDNLPANHIYRYWPTHLAESSRKWIKKNLINGQITGAKVRLNIEPENFTKNKVMKNAVEAFVPFENLILNYYSPLPVLQNAKGSVKLDADSIKIDIQEGHAANSYFNNSSAKITGILNDVPKIEIKSVFQGPVDDIINAVQAVVKQYKGPRSKTARAKTIFNINFPLKDKILSNDIDFNGTSEIDNINLPDYYGLNLTDGNLLASIDTQKFKASGIIKSGKTKININLDSEISNIPESKDTIKLSGILNTDNFSDFNIPELPGIKGTANAEILIWPGALTKIKSVFDITNINLDWKSIGWEKKVGTKAFIRVSAESAQDEIITFSNLNLYGNNFEASGSGRVYTGTNPSLQIFLDNLKFGRNDLKLQFSIDKNKYNAEITGTKLDAVPIINYLYNQDKQNLQNKHNKKILTALKTDSKKIKGQIDANIKQILFLNDKELNNVKAFVKCIGSGLVSADLTGNWDKQKQLTLNISHDKQENILVLTSENAENLLKGLNLFSDIQNGTLSINARYKGSLPTQSPVSGKLKIENFSLVGVPLLVKIISMASFVGIAEQLQSRGIAFGKLDAGFYYDNDILKIEDGLSEGLSMGITGQGDVNLKLGTLDIKGVVIPVNIINKIIDTIPVIGKFITGDGIIATNYRATGAYRNPDVKIEPMSTLAIGGIRKIIDSLKLQKIENPSINLDMEPENGK